MLRILCYMLNGILIAGGFWAFVKLNPCEALTGVAIGLLNVMVLMQDLRKGPMVAVSVVACLLAIVWGVISATGSFADLADHIERGEVGMWAMFNVGYSVSYGFTCIAAGLLTLFTFVRYSDGGTSPLHIDLSVDP